MTCFISENQKHIRRIKWFSSRLLNVSADDIEVMEFSQDDDGLYSAVVRIPYANGYITERVHEYHC